MPMSWTVAVGPLKRGLGLHVTWHVTLVLALAVSVGCRAPEQQSEVPSSPTPSWQTVQAADRITAILFGQVSSVRDRCPSLAHLPKVSPELETACPGPYRRTLLYGVGVDTSLSNPRAWPRARMFPTGILLFVDVRIGGPCIPVPAPIHTIGEVSVQAVCYGRDCEPIVQALSETIAMLKREAGSAAHAT